MVTQYLLNCSDAPGRALALQGPKPGLLIPMPGPAYREGQEGRRLGLEILRASRPGLGPTRPWGSQRDNLPGNHDISTSSIFSDNHTCVSFSKLTEFWLGQQ